MLLFLAALLVLIAATPSFAQSGPAPTASPAGLAATAIRSFLGATVVPVDPDELAVAAFSRLAEAFDGLAVTKSGGGVVVTFEDRSIPVSGALISDPAALLSALYALPPLWEDPEAVSKVQDALTAAFRAFDPYAQVLSRRAHQQRYRALDRGSVGIGIAWYRADGGTHVVRVTEDSPADRAGIREGDRIVAVDGRFLDGMDSPAIHNLLRGPPGTRVTLTLVAASGRHRSVSLTRRSVSRPPASVTPLEDGIVAARVDKFALEVPSLLRAELRRYAGYGKRFGGVVLDLRQNAGGHLHVARQVADLFLSNGTVYETEGPGDSGRTSAEATARRTWRRLPVVVLVDEGTLSSAEIVAAALKNRDRALVIGARTGGKGLGQAVIGLPLGRVLFLSILRVYSAGGATLQGYGVTPHVETVGPFESGAGGDLQPYIWPDPVRANERPFERLDAERFVSDDPEMAAALATLRFWNEHPVSTLLDAYRRTARESRGPGT